jgi:hypothetical protein
MSKRSYLTLVAGLVVLFAVVAGCGGSDEAGDTTTQTTETTTTTTMTEPPETTTTVEPPPGPTVVRVRVVDAAPSGGIVRETVEQGDRVVLVVTSDVSDEIHLHGYDISRDVAAGGTVRLPFRATVPGRFEAELESRGVQIAEITVRP